MGGATQPEGARGRVWKLMLKVKTHDDPLKVGYYMVKVSEAWLKFDRFDRFGAERVVILVWPRRCFEEFWNPGGLLHFLNWIHERFQLLTFRHLTENINRSLCR